MDVSEVLTLILGGGGVAAVAAAVAKVAGPLIRSRDKTVADDRLAKQQERQDAIAGFVVLITELQGIAKDERARAAAEAKRAADATSEHRDCLRKVQIIQDKMQEERQACRDEIEYVRSSLQSDIDRLRSELRSNTSPPPAA